MKRRTTENSLLMIIPFFFWRCFSLSQLLKKKDELQRRNCRDELLLAASKQNLLAFRDQRIKMASPLDTWTARSLPNLHVTHFPDAMQAKGREKAKNFLQ